MSELRDPRVFLAAERTLLAWQRTALALIGFGFLVERSGLLLALLAPDDAPATRAMYWLGLLFIAMGAAAAVASALQHRLVLRSLHPAEFPPVYGRWLAPLSSGVLAGLGVALGLYLAVSGY